MAFAHTSNELVALVYSLERTSPMLGFSCPCENLVTQTDSKQRRSAG